MADTAKNSRQAALGDRLQAQLKDYENKFAVVQGK